MATTTKPQFALQLPPATVAMAGRMFIAGFVATTEFDFWGQVVSPGMGWATLSPHGLAGELLRTLGLPSSAFYGFGLWVFAIGGITSVAGLPFFLGFTSLTWVALVGHVLYGIVMVAVPTFAAGR